MKQMQTGKSGDEGKNYDEIRQKLQNSYERAQENLLMIVGSPKTVTEKIKSILQVLRPGVSRSSRCRGRWAIPTASIACASSPKKSLRRFGSSRNRSNSPIPLNASLGPSN